MPRVWQGGCAVCKRGFGPFPCAKAGELGSRTLRRRMRGGSGLYAHKITRVSPECNGAKCKPLVCNERATEAVFMVGHRKDNQNNDFWTVL